MPFALYGLNRFVAEHRCPESRIDGEAALIGGTAALVMQNWSCGYYLLYFAPFVPLFVLHRMWTLGTLRNVRIWIGLSAAAVGTLVLTLPFLFPYQEAQRVFGIERPFGEIVLFSANVWSYLTASENLRLLGQGACATTRTAKVKPSWGLCRGCSQAWLLRGLVRAGSRRGGAPRPPCLRGELYVAACSVAVVVGRS